jgi:acyl-homoserine lactone acylase PvdQ
VHGPVVGYATVGGRRVAISRKRSTRGREVASALPIEDLMSNRVRSAADFRRTAASGFEVTFNFFYADDRDIAMVSTGRLPVRPAGVDTGLPTIGDGRSEWQGFIAPEQHPQQTKRGGVILNWNNKPARGWTAADDVWHYGSVVRNELFRGGISAKRKHTLPSVVSVMNRAATTDLRNAQLLPVIDGVLRGGPAPSPRAERMLELLRAWRTRGSSRLDRDLDGHIDDPGAAVMDAAYERLADAVMSPVLGPQLKQLDSLNPRSNDANSQGSSYNAGWYSYIDKDLRGLLGRPVRNPFALHYCGNGDLAACRASLWAALDAAGAEASLRYGSPVPDQWRADANAERIKFTPGLLTRTMRWTNRSTFQQVMQFSVHRPRGAPRHRAPRGVCSGASESRAGGPIARAAC